MKKQWVRFKENILGVGFNFDKYTGQSYNADLDIYEKNEWYERGQRRRLKWHEWLLFIPRIPIHFSTLIHELGHYLAAKLVPKRIGLLIGDVVVGKVSAKGYLFHIPGIPLYIYPESCGAANGFVQFKNVHWFRWWGMLIAAGGPIFQFLFFYGLVHLANHIPYILPKVLLIGTCCFGILSAALNFLAIAGGDGLLMSKFASKRLMTENTNTQERSKMNFFQTMKYKGAIFVFLLQIGVLASIHTILWKSIRFLVITIPDIIYFGLMEII
ncbi:hypothetical protein ABHN11_24770 [Brevibacillus centrosporus]|uniref:hypothetical protein n=1 Tax=Brevibacillus centrosporus TaxID=54910 RepID=UPI003D1A941A